MTTRNQFQGKRKKQLQRNALQNFAYQNLEPRNLLAGLLNSQVANPVAGPASLIYDVSDNVPVEERMNFLREHLSLQAGETMQMVELKRDDLGFARFRYQQMYNGISVENGSYSVHVKNRQIVALSGDYQRVGEISTSPEITEQEALDEALNHVGADVYRWDVLGESELGFRHQHNGDLPVAEQTVVKNEKGEFVLAYKFDIFAYEPFSRADVFVDAITGEVVAEQNRIRNVDVPATGMSIYDGMVDFTADELPSYYRLLQNGNNFATYDLQNSEFIDDAIEITSVSNTFTAPHTHTGVQVHYGIEKTLDYFNAEHSFDHGPNGFDAFVNYGVSASVAAWTGEQLIFGEGDGTTITSITSLDVVAHEVSHAISDQLVDLIYERESGALSEAFSDIFGEVVEREVMGSNDWLAAADITPNGRGLRDLADPKSFNNPDTYFGEYWYTLPFDNFGVHINSGVANHWFYLMTEGGLGTNDTGYSYDLEGMGMSTAADITARMFSTYLTSNSNYIDARIAAIRSAIDIYGVNSTEHLTTARAWDAVGVYTPFFEEILSTQGQNPDGSLVYSTDFNQSISLGFDYTYIMPLDADQTLSVAVDGAGSFIPEIGIFDPSLNLVGSINGGADNNAVLQSIEVTESGYYFIVIAGHDSTFGEFNVDIQLNSDIELEGHGGIDNGTLENAQDLEPSSLVFTNASGSVGFDRLAVTGTLANETPEGTVVETESFETGVLDSSWVTNSTGNGQVLVSNAFPAADGSFSLVMDTTGEYALNVADWTVDLSGLESPLLRFQHTEWGDENHPMPLSHGSGFEGDGVSVSHVSTNTWFTVFEEGSTDNGVWEFVEIDLAAAADQFNLPLGPGFQISFRQYDNFGIPDDGRAYDAIEIYDEGTVSDWFTFDLGVDQNATIAANVLDSGRLSLGLYGPSGNLLQSGVPSENLAATIGQLSGAGTYYVRVQGDAEYTLVVTRGGTFDIEPEFHSDAVSLNEVEGVIGHVASVGLVGAEPDEAPSGTVVNYFYPTVVLSNAVTGAEVYAYDGSEFGAPTGTNVFAALPDRGQYWWESFEELRADFEFNQQTVSIDVGSDDASDGGWLRAFNRFGTFLEQVNSDFLSTGQSQTLTISRPSAEIAYVIASGYPSNVTPLDNLTFSVDIFDEDYYSLDVNAGATINLEAQIPGAGPFFFANRLTTTGNSSLKIELFDPSGAMVDMDTWSINHTATMSGTYEIKVSTDQFLGEYVLLNDVVDTTIDEPTGIDFGPEGSDLYNDYANVFDQPYDAKTGYGWQSVTGLTANLLGRGDELTRDRIQLRNGTFVIDVDNGTYNVDVVLGITRKLDSVQITVENEVDTFVPANGPYILRSFTPTVTDGQLTIELDGAGGLVNTMPVSGIRLNAVGGRNAGGIEIPGQPSGDFANTVIFPSAQTIELNDSSSVNSFDKPEFMMNKLASRGQLELRGSIVAPVFDRNFIINENRNDDVGFDVNNFVDIEEIELVESLLTLSEDIRLA